METKQPLPEDLLNKLIEALKESDVEQDYETEYEERTTFISVNDCNGEEVTASYGYYEDSAMSSGPELSIRYTIIADGLKFEAIQHGDNLSDWQLVSRKYFIPEDIMPKIDELLNDVVERVDPFDCYYSSYKNHSFDDEWTNKEIKEEILSQLEHKKYIETEYGIFPLTGSVIDFIKEHYDIDFKVLTAKQTAKELAERIDFDC